MSDDLEPQEECAGGPAWLMTFADLMSLLMSFFVLLLSFSEMDLQKYKQVAGSMKFAFGVQREIKADEIPKGTSIIAQEFSPGKPQPTAIKVMQQQTMEDPRDTLDFIDATVQKEVEDLAQLLESSLKDEIDQGLLEIILEQGEVKVRIREKDTFPSGSAQLQPSVYPALQRIAEVMGQSSGNIIVAGHTDNIPISTAAFRSNWILSAARAASVVHHLTSAKLMAPERIEIRAHADTIPIASNDNEAGRSLNRRVEIIASFKTEDALAQLGEFHGESSDE